MALQMKVTTEHGIVLDAAYIRIDEQGGTKDKLNIRVRTYADKSNCESGHSWIEETIYAFVPSVDDTAPNFIKQGYEYLKTLDEFSDVVDV